MERVITKVQSSRNQAIRLEKVAAYARVSSNKEAMLHSLAAQVNFYRKLILSHPEWMYVGVYTDEALTGTKGNRPAFQKMLTDCRAGKIDRIITKSISRFARNTLDLLDTVRELKLLSVDVFFEEQNIHTMDGDGELLLTILASFAQEESLSASENQKWRIRKNYREGKQAVPGRLYGYRCHKEGYTIVSEEAAVIRMIFADYLSGMGSNAIMRKLTAMGVPTKTGVPWTETSIRQILRNEKHTGNLLLQKEYIPDHLTKLAKRNRGELPKYLVKEHHEAIIDLETFEAVQQEIAIRSSSAKTAKAKSTGIFTGMIRCLRCGSHFHRKIASGGTKYARQAWACPTYINRGKQFCAAKRIPEDILIVKCCEVLHMAVFNEAIFHKNVAEIQVPKDGKLIFKLRDGSEKQITWGYGSRTESWTDEMKQEACKAAGRRHTHA